MRITVLDCLTPGWAEKLENNSRPGDQINEIAKNIKLLRKNYYLSIITSFACTILFFIEKDSPTNNVYFFSALLLIGVSKYLLIELKKITEILNRTHAINT